MKNRVVAALLALFLGSLGVHKFYLGRLFWGVVYLVFCWTGVPLLLGFVEAIRLFVMSEADFHARFNGGVFVGATGGQVVTPATHVRCPDCREFVWKDARKCKHCGAALLPG